MSTSSASADGPHCSDVARAQQLDPVGSAGSYDHIILVEIPLPWPRDIAEHRYVAPSVEALTAAGIRVQAVVPPGDSPPGTRRVLHFWRPSGPFRAYGRTEHLVAEPELAAALSALAHRGTATGASSASPAPPSRARGAIMSTTRPTDVLVCSHGTRDACCGTLGTRLAARLPEALPSTPDVRVWRTSHTGGHRFAPTAIVLPEGTLWAYLDGDVLAGIVRRTLDPGAAAALYRGCTGLDDPALQACDREVLRELGWSWLDHGRTGRVVERHNGRTRVRLDHMARDGRRGAFEAIVEIARWLPVADCRRPLGQARKTAPELRVTALTAL